MGPAEAVAQMEASADVPPGRTDERFAGWGIMGLPFASGHYLVLRRFPASSLGEAYTAVWWRDPSGRWSIFSSAKPELSCPRYFGRAVDDASTRQVELAWMSSCSLHIRIEGFLDWRVDLGTSFATGMMSVLGGAMPRALWRNPLALGLTGMVAPIVLGTGRVRLQGKVPNGQWFQANPRQLWAVTSSTAVVHGEDVGPPAPLAAQTRMGDLWLPQRGLFYIGEGFFEAFDPARHWSPQVTAVV